MMTPDFKDSFGSPEGRQQIFGILPYINIFSDGYWDPERNPGNILINPGPKL
ncbi:MAG: hypothetical protein L3J43_08130 [Sulfurovum sp.]|nr:hypothetical protein [Sulfurovum sp.]